MDYWENMFIMAQHIFYNIYDLSQDLGETIPNKRACFCGEID